MIKIYLNVLAAPVPFLNPILPTNSLYSSIISIESILTSILNQFPLYVFLGDRSALRKLNNYPWVGRVTSLHLWNYFMDANKLKLPGGIWDRFLADAVNSAIKPIT